MRKDRMRLLSSLIVVLAMTSASAQTAAPVPRLVVTVMIDQLRSDYLDAFSPLYGEGGFARLMKDGRVYEGAQYPVAQVDRASSIATMFTGAVPYDHGVVGEQWLDRSTLRPVYCVDDAAFKGWNTTENTSPKNLAVSTISDELKVATDGKALVYSIAPYRDAAVLAAGHAADGAFWINDLTGLWVGSSFYKNQPAWVSVCNNTYPLKKNLGKQFYEPYSAAVGTFNYFPSGGMVTPFKHKFDPARPVASYKTSALVNEHVNHLVEACLNNTTIGADNVTDFLALTYYAGGFEHKTAAESPMEIQDAYVRLDQCIKDLLGAIDRKVGLDKTLVVLTSTGYVENENVDYSAYRIPQGTFYINRTSALLNMYYMAVYGQGQYVDGVFGNQIYLNHKLLEEKQLNIVDVLERGHEFLLQCSGVKDVYTSQRLTQGAWTPGISRMRNGYNPKCSGDIFVEVSPGWRLVNEEMNTSHQVRSSYVEFPLIFFGYNIESSKIFVPTSVDVVVPTLAHFMRIRAPNACSTAPLVFK